MDLKALIGQFFDDQGAIALPPHLTLAGLAEHIYGMEQQAGVPDRPVMRQWVYSDNPEGTPRDITRSQVNTRIKVVATRSPSCPTCCRRAATTLMRVLTWERVISRGVPSGLSL